MPRKQEVVGPEAIKKTKGYSSLFTNMAPMTKDEIEAQKKQQGPSFSSGKTTLSQFPKPFEYDFERKQRVDKAAKDFAFKGVAAPIVGTLGATAVAPAVATAATGIGSAATRIGAAAAPHIKKFAKDFGKEALKSGDDDDGSDIKSAAFDVVSKAAKGIFGLFKGSKLQQNKKRPQNSMRTKIKTSSMRSGSQESKGEKTDAP